MVLTVDRGDETVDGILFASCKVNKNIIFMKCSLLLLFQNLNVTICLTTDDRKSYITGQVIVFHDNDITCASFRCLHRKQSQTVAYNEISSLSLLIKLEQFKITWQGLRTH